MGDTDGIRIYVLILKHMRVLFGRETGENRKEFHKMKKCPFRRKGTLR